MIEGDISKKHLSLLRKEYGKNVKLITDNDSVDVFETDWYKNIKSNMTPGKNLKIYRINRGLTQEQLGELLDGIQKQHISNMENGKRAISLKMAKRLSKLFKTSVERFI